VTTTLEPGQVIGTQQLPCIVPRDLGELKIFLQGALELEHLTIPPYLTALYTIRPGTNRTAFYAIRSVVLEEMLHMTLVANLLNAIGGAPKVDHPNFVRSYPAKLPYSALKLEVPLEHFSLSAMKTFLAIENPWEPNLPPSSGWRTIGQFYARIREGLINLDNERRRSGGIFTGDRERQVGPRDFYNSGGEVFEVTDLASALTALRVVIEQGEGLHESIWDPDDQLFGEQRQVAHYFRFNEILEGRAYGPHDTPTQPPSGPALDVTWQDTYPIDTAASCEQFREFDEQVYKNAMAFNVSYARMLAFLQQAFNGQPHVMHKAVPAMLSLRDQAERLYRNPHPDPKKAACGLHASATFEIGPEEIGPAQKYVAARLSDLDQN
jgi:Ferritin-like